MPGVDHDGEEVTQPPVAHGRRRPELAPNHDPRYVSPFRRLARVHALMASGDAVMAVALADSLFLSISPDVARGKVLQFLAISFIPFAVVAPLIGPVIDTMRGGRRMVIALTALLRVAIAVAMIGRVDDLVLFPLAFAALVLQKTYAVSKSALVPTVVRGEEELVEANSKLGLLSGLTGAVIAIPAVLVQRLIGSDATLTVNAVVFSLALLAVMRLPREVVAQRPAAALERLELRTPSIVLGATAMMALRAGVGFVFFHLAFWLRGQDSGTLWFGLALTVSVLATMTGNIAAPALRRRLPVEVMLIGALGFLAVGALGVAFAGGVRAAVALAGVANLAAAVGRLAFEAIIQRDAPDANRGRAFAKFEVRFQLAWVVAGLAPVVISFSDTVGPLVVALMAGGALANYVQGQRMARRGQSLGPSNLARLRLLSARVRSGRATTPARRPPPGSATPRGR